MKKGLMLIFAVVFSLQSFAAQKIVTIAKIESSQEVIHSSDLGGKILNIYYQNGDFVKKGQVIMTLDNAQVKAAYDQSQGQYLATQSNFDKTKKFSKDQQILNLERAEKNLTAAKMSLQKAQKGTKAEQLDQLKLNVDTTKTNYETNKKTYEKNKTLYSTKAISEQQFLQVKTQFETSENAYLSAQKALTLAEKGADEEDIKTLKASVVEAQENYDITKKMIDQQIWNYDIKTTESSMNSAKAAYDYAKTRFDELSVKAETTGYITGLDIVQGNKAVPGKQLFSIINADSMVVKIGVDEKYIADFNKNSKVDIFVTVLNKHFVGKIESISPKANEKTKKFDVKIKVVDTSHILKDGMHGQVTIN